MPIIRARTGVDREVSAGVAPALLTSGGDGTVFLTHMGEPFDRRQLTALVRDYLIESKVGKMGGCHLFRHTVATPMLENSGAEMPPAAKS